MVNSEPGDDELVAAARAGDGEAFDLLMRRYERLVYRVASGFSPGREGALDLVQATFLKAFRSLGSFRGESSFKTWLLRIAYHEGLNESKRMARHAARDVELEVATEAVSSPAEAEERLLADERRSVLERALASLHHRYRAAVLLRYREGLAIRDIAAALDCSETMTKNLLFRGVRQLRRAVVEAL